MRSRGFVPFNKNENKRSRNRCTHAVSFRKPLVLTRRLCENSARCTTQSTANGLGQSRTSTTQLIEVMYDKSHQIASFAVRRNQFLHEAAISIQTCECLCQTRLRGIVMSHLRAHVRSTHQVAAFGRDRTHSLKIVSITFPFRLT